MPYADALMKARELEGVVMMQVPSLAICAMS